VVVATVGLEQLGGAVAASVLIVAVVRWGGADKRPEPALVASVDKTDKSVPPPVKAVESDKKTETGTEKPVEAGRRRRPTWRASERPSRSR